MIFAAEYINTLTPFIMVNDSNELKRGDVVYRQAGFCDDDRSVAFGRSPRMNLADPKLDSEWTYCTPEDVKLATDVPGTPFVPASRRLEANQLSIGETVYDIGAPLRFHQLYKGEVFRSRNSGNLYVKISDSRKGNNAVRLQPGDGVWFRTFSSDTNVDPLSPADPSSAVPADDFAQLVTEVVEQAIGQLSGELARHGQPAIEDDVVQHVAAYVGAVLRRGSSGSHMVAGDGTLIGLPRVAASVRVSDIGAEQEAA